MASWSYYLNKQIKSVQRNQDITFSLEIYFILVHLFFHKFKSCYEYRLN